jgi:hypothetical protein
VQLLIELDYEWTV